MLTGTGDLGVAIGVDGAVVIDLPEDGKGYMAGSNRACKLPPAASCLSDFEIPSTEPWGVIAGRSGVI